VVVTVVGRTCDGRGLSGSQGLSRRNRRESGRHCSRRTCDGRGLQWKSRSESS